MCNACGFFCCAYDGFRRCGCDECPEVDCWSEEAFEDEFGDGDFEDDDYYESAPRCSHRPRFECTEVTP